MEPNEEKRSSSRISLDNFQRVRDAESGELMGYLGDVSLVGVKILGKKPVEIGKLCRLRVNYICVGGEKLSTEVEAESIWDREDDNMPYREIGFRFLDLPPEARATIERIMADLKARES